MFRTTICGTLVESGAVGAELGVDRVPLLVGRLRRVDHVDERARALEVREELVAEPDALARSLDQPGHVGDDQLPAVGRLDRAEHRLQRRERIVGDLRPRVRDARDQSDDLPAFGSPTSAASASSFRCSSTSRSSPGGPTSAKRGTCRVDETKRALPRPPWPPCGEHDPRARVRQVGDQLAVVGEDLRADRDAQLDVGAVGAVLARAAAVLAARRP